MRGAYVAQTRTKDLFKLTRNPKPEALLRYSETVISEKKAVTNFSQNDWSSSASVNSLEPAPAFRAEASNEFGFEGSCKRS